MKRSPPRSQFARAFVVCGLLLAASSIPPAGGGDAKGRKGGLAQLAPGGEPIRLLADRLRLRVPPNGKEQPRQRGVMAVPESPEETRLVVEAGEERLVLMAY